MFRLRGRVMRFSVPLSGTADPAIQRTSTGRQRTSVQLREAANQALRQRWRALLLYIKAALEMVENDVMTVEQAFLQAVVLPNGATIGELTEPHIERFALEGRVPAMLGGPPQ